MKINTFKRMVCDKMHKELVNTQKNILELKARREELEAMKTDLPKRIQLNEEYTKHLMDKFDEQTMRLLELEGKKGIHCYNPNGELVKIYYGYTQCEIDGYQRGNVWRAVNGKNGAYGHIYNNVYWCNGEAESGTVINAFNTIVDV